MKRTLLVLLLTGVAAGEAKLQAQGPFQNLDFEAARPVILSGLTAFVATTNAFPGWTAEYGGRQLNMVLYRPAILAEVTLLGLYGSSLDGSFSAGIGGDANGTASLSQTGLVPADARSLRFLMLPNPAAVSPTPPLDMVSLGGQSLPLVALAPGPKGSALYGADISRFAGQAEALSFYAIHFSFALDDIEFSPQIVPEPPVFALAAAAVSLLLCRRFGGRSGRLVGGADQLTWNPQRPAY